MYINSDNLFILKKDKITIFTDKIEDELLYKNKIQIYYMSYSNSSFSISFNIGSLINFKSSRIIKKYFLDNIPFVTKMVFSEYGFTVDFDRSNGIDVLDVYSIY